MFNKCTSILVLMSFLLSCVFGDCLHAFTKRQNPIHRNNLPDGLVIPPAAGKITDYFCGSPRQELTEGRNVVVINIQDLHCNPEVQKNIALILSALDERYGLKNVYVEGGYGDVDTSRLCNIKDNKIKKGIIETLLNEGRLTGSEYYSIMSHKPYVIRGIENENIHRQNIGRLGKILERKDSYKKEIAELEGDLELMKARYLHSRNKRLEKYVSRYREGDLSPEKYYRLLKKYVDKIQGSPEEYRNIFDISMADYPDIEAYTKLADAEKRLNYKKINRQLHGFVKVIKSKLPYSVYADLAAKTENFTKLNEGHFYPGEITGLQQGYELRPAFPDLYGYFDYVEKYQQFNPVKLIQEEKKLVSEIKIAFSQDICELEVSFLSDFFYYFKQYLLCSISAEDHGYFVQRFDKFSRLWDKYAFSNKVTDLESDFPLLNEYYRTNCKRNECFIDNIPQLRAAEINTAPGAGAKDKPVSPGTASAASSSLNRTISKLLSDAEIVVIVSGGFHTDGLKKLLSAGNITNITITPAITRDTGISSALYEELAKEQALRNGQEGSAGSVSRTVHPLMKAGVRSAAAWGFPQDSLALGMASEASSQALFEQCLKAANKELQGTDFTEENVRRLIGVLTDAIGDNNINMDLTKFNATDAVIVFNNGTSITLSAGENNSIKAAGNMRKLFADSTEASIEQVLMAPGYTAVTVADMAGSQGLMPAAAGPLKKLMEFAAGHTLSMSDIIGGPNPEKESSKGPVPEKPVAGDISPWTREPASGEFIDYYSGMALLYKKILSLHPGLHGSSRILISGLSLEQQLKFKKAAERYLDAYEIYLDGSLSTNWFHQRPVIVELEATLPAMASDEYVRIRLTNLDYPVPEIFDDADIVINPHVQPVLKTVLSEIAAATEIPGGRDQLYVARRLDPDGLRAVLAKGIAPSELYRLDDVKQKGTWAFSNPVQAVKFNSGSENMPASGRLYLFELAGGSDGWEMPGSEQFRSTPVRPDEIVRVWGLTASGWEKIYAADKESAGEADSAAKGIISRQLSHFRSSLSRLYYDGRYTTNNPFTDPADFILQLIRQANENGHSAIEIYPEDILKCDIKNGFPAAFDSISRRSEDIKRLSEILHIEVIVHLLGHAYKDDDGGVYFPEPRKEKELFMGQLEFAGNIGAHTITVHLVNTDDESLSAIADFVKEAAKRKITVGVENAHYNRALYTNVSDALEHRINHTVDEYIQTMETISGRLLPEERRYLAFTIDIPRAGSTGDPTEYYKKVKSAAGRLNVRISNIHIAQTRKVESQYTKYPIHLEGAVPIVQFFAMLIKDAYAGFINQELNGEILSPRGGKAEFITEEKGRSVTYLKRKALRAESIDEFMEIITQIRDMRGFLTTDKTFPLMGVYSFLEMDNSINEPSEAAIVQRIKRGKELLAEIFESAQKREEFFEFAVSYRYDYTHRNRLVPMVTKLIETIKERGDFESAGSITILDVGTAPKVNGSPTAETTLEMFRKAFPGKNIIFKAVDINFPPNYIFGPDGICLDPRTGISYMKHDICSGPLGKADIVIATSLLDLYTDPYMQDLIRENLFASALLYTVIQKGSVDIWRYGPQDWTKLDSIILNESWYASSVYNAFGLGGSELILSPNRFMNYEYLKPLYDLYNAYEGSYLPVLKFIILMFLRDDIIGFLNEPHEFDYVKKIFTDESDLQLIRSFIRFVRQESLMFHDFMANPFPKQLVQLSTKLLTGFNTAEHGLDPTGPIAHIIRSEELDRNIGRFASIAGMDHVWYTDLPAGASENLPVFTIQFDKKNIDVSAGLIEGKLVFYMDLRKAGVPSGQFNDALSLGAAQIIQRTGGTDNLPGESRMAESVQEVYRAGGISNGEPMNFKTVMVIEHLSAGMRPGGTQSPQEPGTIKALIKKGLSLSGINSVVIISSDDINKDIHASIKKIVVRNNAVCVTMGEKKLLKMDDLGSIQEFRECLKLFNEAGNRQMIVDWNLFSDALRKGDIDEDTITLILKKAKMECGVIIHCEYKARADRDPGHTIHEVRKLTGLGFAGVSLDLTDLNDLKKARGILEALKDDPLIAVNAPEGIKTKGRKISVTLTEAKGMKFNNDDVIDVTIPSGLSMEELLDGMAQLPLSNTIIFHSADAANLIRSHRDITDKKAFASLFKILLNYGKREITSVETARRLGYNSDISELPGLSAEQTRALIEGTLVMADMDPVTAVFDQADALERPELASAFRMAIAEKLLIRRQLSLKDPELAEAYRTGKMKFNDPSFEMMLGSMLLKLAAMSPDEIKQDVIASLSIQTGDSDHDSAILELYAKSMRGAAGPGSITAVINGILNAVFSDYYIGRSAGNHNTTFDSKLIGTLLEAA